MTSPAKSVFESEPVEQVASALAEGNLHHLAVVTDEGSVVGVVSALDVIKAMLGVPVTHPAAFPHYDRRTGLIWTDDTISAWSERTSRRNGGWVLALITGGVGRVERIV